MFIVITIFSHITNAHISSIESNSLKDNAIHLNYIVFDVSKMSIFYVFTI